ncbi:MAG: DUF1566 domain-containing protein, partial [Myxococcales bacterium]|nr:DUF1566 domain-containing protein [Myxococcales bacterium]
TTAASAVKAPAGDAAKPDAPKEAAKDEPAKAVDDGAEAKDEPDADDEVEAADETVASPPSSDDDPPEPVAGLPGSGTIAFVPGEPMPPPPEHVTVAEADDPPEVAKALRDREVRAVDLFLVAPERPGTLRFDSAVDHCRELEVAGLTGWRVPSIGELNAIATARMLGKAIYWSATPGDTFGDMMLVLNTKKDRITVVTKGWDGAKIVCIRLRQP